MNRNDGWEGLLDEGEEILWQGRPDPAWAFSQKMFFMVPFSLFFTGFAMFWMVMAMQAGGFFWMFGLLHFGVGFAMLCSTLFGGAFMRRYTWYTLTDRRALIASDLPIRGRKLDSWPIDAGTRFSLTDTTPGTVIFAHKTKRGQNGTYEVPVGFERIHDAREVFALMRAQQDKLRGVDG